MIILSGVLVVAAFALLVAGIVAGNGDSAQVFGLDALVVIYISIGVSIVSALCLATGVFLRRRELWGPGASPTGAGRKSKKRDKKAKKSGRTAVPAGRAKAAPEAAAAQAPDEKAEIPVQPVDVPEDALVHVVRGRKRYHLDTCRQLAGRETEELTYAEAKEEGFSSCTACLPDTALAARAAAVAGAPAKASESGSGAVPGKASGGGFAGLTKPAPAASDRTAELPHPVPADERSGGTAAESAVTSPFKPVLPGPPDGSVPTGSGSAGSEPDAVESAASPLSAPVESEPGGAGPLPSAWGRPGAGTKAGPATPDLPLAGPRTPEPTVLDMPVAGPASTPVPETGDADTGGDDASSPLPSPRASGDTEEPAAADGAPAPEDDEGPQVRILSGTKRYHRVDCALIEDIGDEADDLESLSRAEAKARGCTPCLVCQPDRERARD